MDILILGGSMFLKAVRFLKSISKSKYPIKVRRQNIKQNLNGFCMKKEDYFLIVIDKSLSEAHAIDVLIHEIAHAETWSKGVEHGLDWAISFQRIYQIWEKSIS